MVVENALATQKYTRVLCEERENWEYGAPHHFIVAPVNIPEGEPVMDLQYVDFQCGPIKENGVNGVANEDLLLMVLTRLQAFQETEFECRENAMAVEKIEEALMWLRKRTMEREARNVVGTHIV